VNNTYEEEKINNTAGITRVGEIDKSSIDNAASNFDQPSIEDDFGFGTRGDKDIIPHDGVHFANDAVKK